jgi:hypothetical protein
MLDRSAIGAANRHENPHRGWLPRSAAPGKSGARARPRAVPDISMSGACDGAVTMYYSVPGGVTGWHLGCGTSEAAPGVDLVSRAGGLLILWPRVRGSR